MSDRQIHNLVVLCSNEKIGCKWRGKLNELNGHLETTCQLEAVQCPKGCGVSLKRLDIVLHIKSECSQLVINCPHCLVRGEKHFIEGRHLEECSNCPLSCPNHCSATISSSDFDEHKNICPLEVVNCEFNSLGCNTDMPRKDVKTHNKENLTNHLNLAKRRLACSTKELESSKTQLAMVEKELNAFKASSADIIEEILSMIRLLSQLDVVREEEKINIFWQISLYYKSLLSVQGDKVAPVILKMNGFAKFRRNGTMWYSAPFFTHRQGYKLCVCVSAAGDRDASVDKDAREGNYISVYIAVMEGPYDSQLTWPMEGVIHVTLLNQLYSANIDLNYSMTINLPDTPLFPFNSTLRVTQENKTSGVKTSRGVMSSTGIGSCKFFPLAKLTEMSPQCQFLQDDCIFLKVKYKKQLGNTLSPNSCAYNNQSNKPVKPYYRPSYHDGSSVLKENVLPANNLQSRPTSDYTPRQVPKIPETDTRL